MKILGVVPFLLLYFFSIILPIDGACAQCGKGMTSAKRLKMIFKADNHEVCAQYCDEQKKCSIFEFDFEFRTCFLSMEYEQIDSDLFAGAFDTIIYLKVKGVFSKSLSKEKHSCVGMVEFQEYVTHEVPKWLKPVKKAVQKHSSVPVSPTPGETDNDANSGGGSSVLMPSNAATVKEQNESTKLTSSTELYGTISMGTTSVGEAREITTVTHFELPSQKTSVSDTLESRLISSSTYDEPHEEKESPTAMTVSSERVMEHNEASSVATLGTMASAFPSEDTSIQPSTQPGDLLNQGEYSTQHSEGPESTPQDQYTSSTHNQLGSESTEVRTTVLTTSVPLPTSTFSLQFSAFLMVDETRYDIPIGKYYKDIMPILHNPSISGSDSTFDL